MSHVIPEFMYKPLYDRMHRMIRVAERAGRHTRQKPAPKGVREALLCLKCEQYLNDSFEKPGLALWRAMVTQKPVGTIVVNHLQLEHNLKVLRFQGFDHAAFKLLLLSVLWRASVAAHEDYAAVDLGPHENTIREMLRKQNPGSAGDYPCLICLPTEPGFGLMATPVKTKLEGHTAYKFLLPGVLLCFVVASGTRPCWTTIQQGGCLIAPLIRRQEAPFFRNVGRLLTEALKASAAGKNSGGTAPDKPSVNRMPGR